MTTSCKPPDPIDPELTKPLPERVHAQDVGWEEAHRLNTAITEEWRIRYESLVKAVRLREEGN